MYCLASTVQLVTRAYIHVVIMFNTDNTVFPEKSAQLLFVAVMWTQFCGGSWGQIKFQTVAVPVQALTLATPLLRAGFRAFHDGDVRRRAPGFYFHLLQFNDAASPSDVISELLFPCGLAKRWSCWFRKTKSCAGKYIRVFSPNKQHQRHQHWS